MSDRKFSNLCQRLQTAMPRPPYFRLPASRQRASIAAHVLYVGEEPALGQWP